MGAIYRREIGAFFTSSIAYVFLSVFYIITGFFFFLANLGSSSADLSMVYLTMFIISIFLIPLLTMRLFSEEKKQRTEQGLLTAPVSLTGIVLGKYFAALTIFIIAAADGTLIKMIQTPMSVNPTKQMIRNVLISKILRVKRKYNTVNETKINEIPIKDHLTTPLTFSFCGKEERIIPMINEPIPKAIEKKELHISGATFSWNK